MSRIRIKAALILPGVAACLLRGTEPPLAEDLRHRWSIAGHVSFLSTKDDIRSNSTLVLGRLGDDGVPYTFDPNEDLNCDQVCDPSVDPGCVYCDPRPDVQSGRYTRVHDAAQYGLEISYGATSWLSLRLDAGWSKSDIGPVSLYVSDHFPREPAPLTVFKDRDYTETFVAGSLTEMPVSLSGVVRFRLKRPVNPYLIVGAGKLFTNADRSEDLRAMNDRLEQQRIRGVSNETLHNVVPISILDFAFDARIPYIWQMKPRVSNGFEWHLGAGVEYFFSDRLSLGFEGRYLATGETLDLDLGHEDQVNVVTWSERAFRPDGSVRIFAPAPLDPNGMKLNPPGPNPYCYQTGFRGLGCGAYTGDLGRRVDPEGDGPNGRPLFTCPAQGDFDRDGRLDLCYGRNVAASFTGYKEPRADIIVQGGRINLSNVQAGITLRLHF